MRGPDLDGIKTLDPQAIFSVGEAAGLLGLSHNGVLQRIKAGKLRTGKSGNRYFIPGAEIQKQIVLPTDGREEIDL